MKPNQEQIADLWCRLMHTALMWPSHGQYECRTCGRRHRVCWEQYPPAEPCVIAMSFETRAQNAFGNNTCGSNTCGSNNGVDPMFGNSGQGRYIDFKNILCQLPEERDALDVAIAGLGAPGHQQHCGPGSPTGSVTKIHNNGTSHVNGSLNPRPTNRSQRKGQEIGK
jgi:hypothetical protein